VLCQQLATRNGDLVESNKLLLSVTACNSSLNLLGSPEQALNALFYLVKYLTKDALESRNSMV
jgi:hypothetical protein